MPGVDDVGRVRATRQHTHETRSVGPSEVAVPMNLDDRSPVSSPTHARLCWAVATCWQCCRAQRCCRQQGGRRLHACTDACYYSIQFIEKYAGVCIVSAGRHRPEIYRPATAAPNRAMASVCRANASKGWVMMTTTTWPPQASALQHAPQRLDCRLTLTKATFGNQGCCNRKRCQLVA